MIQVKYMTLWLCRVVVWSSVLCIAQQPFNVVTVILPGNLKWASSGVDRIEVAPLAGDARNTSSSMWVGRAKFGRDSKLMPHSHPDTRYVTVLSGTYYQAISDRFDPSLARAYPPGSFLIVPAGVKHFVWAKEGEVIIQEQGTSPTAITFVDSPTRQR